MRFLTPLIVLVLLAASAAGAASSAPVDVSPSPAPVSAVFSPAPATVAVAEPAAPPTWEQDLLVAAEKLPVLGPIVTKAFVYIGVLSTLLTMLIAFLLSALSAIASVSNFAGSAVIAQKISDFKNGKVMYWIKFFSLFNAKKPPTE